MNKHKETKTRISLSEGIKPAITPLIALVRPRRTEADHPVLVALIGAQATVDAALIGAGATVAVAVIAGGTAIAVTVLGGDDEDGEEGEEKRIALAPGPGGRQQTRTISASELPPAVRGYINRDVDMSASSLPAPSGNGDQEVSAIGKYRFDGLITRFKPDVQRFNFKDHLALRFTIANLESAEDAPLNFKVDQLLLSTVDSPDTDGYSDVEFTAVQDDDVLWHWSARVNQGKTPTIDGPVDSSAIVVRDENDLLFIRDLEVPIKYRAPGATETTVVDVVMNVEGQGART